MDDRDCQSPVLAAAAPADWSNSFCSPPDLCSASGSLTGALLRRWRNTSPDMEQPRLDRDYVVLHLEGAKRIMRSGEGPALTADAPVAAITVVPAGAAHSWSTLGPIGFAHLYLGPDLVARTVQDKFDRDPRSVVLTDCVGCDLPLLRALFIAMIAEVESPGFASRLVLDTLLQTFVVQLLRQSSTLAGGAGNAPHSTAPRRLQRVLDYMEAHLADEIELDDLAGVAGSSRFHFSRAFREATGFPPYRYLVHRRINAAKTLLLTGDELTLEQIAAQCGFKSSAQFSVMFKQVFGTTPSRFRREH
jgi:AraC family transcriptional regulator